MTCEVCNGSGFVQHSTALVDFCLDCETGRGLERASGYRCPCCGGDGCTCVLTPTGCVPLTDSATALAPPTGGAR